MTENPFNPNIIFTISEVEEYNPFKPILGEGGYNSGKKIPNSDTILPVDSTDRNRKIWTNAQRTYRNRNRDAYNANMLNLWRKNKEANNDSYKTWLYNQTNANEKYRLKKKLEKLKSTQFSDLKTVPTKIKKAVDAKWRNTPKDTKAQLTKKVGKKVSEYKPELYKKAWEAQRDAEIEQIEKKLGDNKTIEKGKFKQVEKDDRKVNSSLSSGDYAEVDYKGLEVGSNELRRANNLQDLNTYYNTVLTTKSPVPTGVAFKEKTKIDIKKLRDSHRDNLHAGDWTLEGDYKRRLKKPSNRPTGERYEKKGENKI
jgi:hypothetical protein